MVSYREVIPERQQCCGNCRHWDEAHIVEIPLYKAPDREAVLAPCKRFISDEDIERRTGWRIGRMFTDEDHSCPDWGWMPSKEYLKAHPQVKKALAEECRKMEAA